MCWFMNVDFVLNCFIGRYLGMGLGLSVVWCWLYYFDIVIFIYLEEGDLEDVCFIGVGMFFGDEFYFLLYFYVSLWFINEFGDFLDF